MADKISLVGLGKLGLCMASCFAAKGFETIGIDIDENIVNAINAGKSPIIEPGLQELITKAGKRFKATLNHEEAINETDVTFIMVSTPSNTDGTFSNKYIESALKSLAESFRKSNKKYHLFIVSSTVMPGSTVDKFIPIIEQYSGKKLNVDFGLCYDPDFVALGSVIKDYLNPDFIVIGESNKFAGDQVADLHKRICENKPRIFQMSIIDAEITKDPEKIKTNLVDQLTHRTLWEASVMKAVSLGVKDYLEVGPGSILKGLLKKIDNSLNVTPLHAAGDIASLLQAQGDAVI